MKPLACLFALALAVSISSAAEYLYVIGKEPIFYYNACDAGLSEGKQTQAPPDGKLELKNAIPKGGGRECFEVTLRPEGSSRAAKFFVLNDPSQSTRRFTRGNPNRDPKSEDTGTATTSADGKNPSPAKKPAVSCPQPADLHLARKSPSLSRWTLAQSRDVQALALAEKKGSRITLMPCEPDTRGRDWILSDLAPRVVRPRAKGAADFLYLELVEYYGYKEKGRARLDPAAAKRWIPVREAKADHWSLGNRNPKFELLLPGSRAMTTELEAREQRVSFRIAVVASAHELSLAPLGQWDGDWGSSPEDEAIDRQIVWYPLELNGQIRTGIQVGSFSELSRHAVPDPAFASGFDRERFFPSLTVLLSRDFQGDRFDYLVSIKDSWEVSANGIEAARKGLEKVAQDRFDVLATQPRTATYGYLMALAAEAGGRYFESTEKTRFVLRDLDMASRLNGKTRTRSIAKARAKGFELPQTRQTASVTILKDDPYFETGNLLTIDQHNLAVSLLETAQCASRTAPDEQVRILSKLRDGAPVISADRKLGEMFREVFLGFQIPPGSPFANKTLNELASDARGSPLALQTLIHALTTLPKECEVVFVPDSIFLAAK
jgi:hypothetical protein